MKTSRKEKSRVVLICFLLLTFSAFFSYASGISYETKDYHVDLIVHEDNTFSVKEVITVDFTTPAHGIYRYITVGGDIFYNDENGDLQSIRGNLKISNVDAGDVELDESTDSYNVVLRLGSPDITLTGLKTYTLTYDAQAYDDGVESFDQVYWDLIPTGWETSIEHASFTVTMPKDFDYENANVIVGAVGSGDESRAAFSSEGSVFTGEVIGSLAAYEGVTFRTILPEGYFVNERTDTWMVVVAIIAAVAAALGALFLFFRYGKDKKIIPVVEFYPPDDLSPAEVGYVLNGVANSKDLLSLIPYFAEKGFLEINRLEPKKKFLGADIEQYELRKLKDLPNSAPNYQDILFKGLFSYGDSVNIGEIPPEFGDKFKASQDSLKSFFDKNKSKHVFSTSSKVATAGGCLLTVIPILAFIVAAGIAVVSEAQVSLVTIVSFASFFIALLCTIFMRKRTDYSVELMGRLNGFKNFIKVADVDRINTLVHEDPKYFYNILPYAYVFGLTDAWIKNFEGIQMEPPTWYRDNFNTFNMVYLMRSFDSIAATLPTSPPASEGSFSGGGSSGGGFSGGGFGGGGGGAW
ncbi:MAG: DUF2207 domain-containing protein [Clostridia bacterium]|nr:DUF2207 domain-containing protein [Clostridia bacterium]